MAVNGDDSFEQDVRSTLRELAPDGAPERLVSRVGAIPGRERVSRRRTFAFGLGLGQLASAAAGVAAVALIAAAAILSRGGPAPIVGGTPSQPPASFPAQATAPSASGPVAQATPTPTATPQPSGTPVPSGFSAMSVTFVSPDEGFVLGGVSCSSGTCPLVARTLDAGKTWSSLAGPSTSVNAVPGPAAASGVSGVRFADRLDGWAYGPELWATHDGGRSWHRVAIPGVSQPRVLALEAANGRVHAVLYDDAQPRFRIASAAIASDDWQLSPVSLVVGAGPVPTVQLVLSGAAGWVIENDRTVVAGAHLVSGQWQSWAAACRDVVGPAVLAASSPGNVIAACNVGLWATPQGEHLYVSTDGGSAFTKRQPTIPIDVQDLAAASSATIVAAGTGNAGSQLVGSFDGGAAWSALTTPAQGVTWTDLGFTTASQGVAIETAQGAAGRLLMTRDGGRTWAPVSFEATGA